VNTEDVIRRSTPGGYFRRRVPVVSSVPLPPPLSSHRSFAATINGRESAGAFSPPTISELSSFLHYVSGIRRMDSTDANRQKRFVASMGALHPAHILVYLPDEGWRAYLPEGHALGSLQVNTESSAQLLDLVDQHLPGHRAAILCLLSDRDLASNYYDNYVPLLLRDAGVLLGHASLVAAAHELAFRILGRTGTIAAESLIPLLPFRPLATGLALLGAGCVSGDAIRDDRNGA
jgi:hypothetical protein